MDEGIVIVLTHRTMDRSLVRVTDANLAQKLPKRVHGERLGETVSHHEFSADWYYFNNPSCCNICDIMISDIDIL